jgi:hypothetical protein
MVIKVDPCIDFAFKWLFGREENLPLLVDLLNAVLQPATDSGITGLELLNPFSSQDSPEDKLSIVDVKARDSSGRQFDVEMLLLRDRSFCKRVLYYWAGLHLRQLGTGEPYSRVSPTVSVCFTNFVMFEDVGDYYQVFELRNRQGKLSFSSDIMLITLDLSGRKSSTCEVLAEGNLVRTSLRYSNGLILSRLQVSIRLKIVAAVWPPSSEPAKGQSYRNNPELGSCSSFRRFSLAIRRFQSESCQSNRPSLLQNSTCFSPLDFQRSTRRLRSASE